MAKALRMIYETKTQKVYFEHSFFPINCSIYTYKYAQQQRLQLKTTTFNIYLHKIFIFYDKIHYLCTQEFEK